MATVYKNSRVQGTASVGTYTTLYNTGASTSAVISTLAICNTSTSTQTYRIGIMGSAGTPGAGDWLVYDAAVAAKDTAFLTLGISLGNSEFIRVSSSANSLSFTAYISEIS